MKIDFYNSNDFHIMTYRKQRERRKKKNKKFPIIYG